MKQDEAGRGSGQWVLTGRVPNRRNEKSLFSDILDVANENSKFSYVASLYNLYVYFWRWAIWKAFEAHGNGPGVVAFITGSSWLAGPGFMGLRKLAREHADEIYVIDLGGDSHGVPKEENVFAIQTPVSIVVLVRNNATEKRNQAKTFYKKITGTAKEKLEAVSEFSTSSNPLELFGSALEPVDILAPLVPETGSDLWDRCVKLTTLFPWQQPGCMHSRSWPISVDPSVLEKRWAAFVKAPIENRAELYVTPTKGRNIYTNVPGHKQLAALKAGDPHEKIVRFGYRAFDRQWTFEDPRLAKTESPALWESQSEKQIFIVCPMTEKVCEGQLATISAHVPDKHYFKGSGGGSDVLALYRDASAKNPNLPKGLLTLLSCMFEKNQDPEAVAAYTYFILSAHGYYDTFKNELNTPGPRMRIPVTSETNLWNAAVETGNRLIWLHTFAERFVDKTKNRPNFIKKAQDIDWLRPVTNLPESSEHITYDSNNKELHISDGIVGGVSLEIWNYKVSGKHVVKQWLGYRTRKGAGKAASRGGLDAIKVTEWKDEWNDELLDLLSVLTETIELQKEQAEIFDKIVSGSLIDPAKIEALPGDTSVPKT